MKKHGFTLIEISIALVIIGLIVGGILVGRSLVKAAEIRATILQLERYNTSVNTFRNKYRYIPGDLPSPVAAQLGFFAETTAGGTVGHQDGNGLILDWRYGGMEPFGFWRHLSDAQMIDGSYGTAASGNPLVVTTGAPTAAANAGGVAALFPLAKLGRANYFIPYSLTVNYYQIGQLTSVSGVGTFLPSSSITPIEAREIDSKIDDGLPLTGKTLASTDPTEIGGGLIFPGQTCIVVATGQYDISAANVDRPGCQLQIRMD